MRKVVYETTKLQRCLIMQPLKIVIVHKNHFLPLDIGDLWSYKEIIQLNVESTQ